MKKLKIAIVGRPNVGKSALFNRITKKRIAIVDEMEGVTRDRLYADAELFGTNFEIIDTGGIDPSGKVVFSSEVKAQAEAAISEADSIILVVDSRVGVTTADEVIAKVLLKGDKPVVLAVNKVDSEFNAVYTDFYSLGFKEIFSVSAIQGHNIAELLQAALDACKITHDTNDTKAPSVKVAIIGSPNVGKSSFINTLLNEKRCVVSPLAGTTRDSIDVFIQYKGNTYLFIDTAGIRRKNSEHVVVDKFAAIRTQRAIDRCDVCILMLDSTKGLSTQEKKIASMIEEKGKGLVIFFNKWDLVKGYRMEHCLKSIENDAGFLSYCSKVFGSALTGRNIDELFERIQVASAQTKMRISTGRLNKFIENTIRIIPPPMINGKRLRIYYMSQIDISPPRFVFFVNNPKLMTDTYKRYLMNRFRMAYSFKGSPLVFYFKGKKKPTTRQDQIDPQESFLEEDLVFEDENVGSHLNISSSITTVL